MSATVTLYCFVAVIRPLEPIAAFTVKVYVPFADGLPEIVPVDEPRVRPAGRVPDETDHFTGHVPPVIAAVRGWL